MPLQNWTEEQLGALRRLWAEDLSASQISARLGKTRNSVLGKAHRLGLARRDYADGRPRTTPVERPRQPRATPSLSGAEGKFHQGTRHRGPVLQKFLMHKAAQQARLEPPEPPPPHEGKGKTLFQLGQHDCRWPYGDPRHALFHFCGNRCEDDAAVYCNAHRAMAFVSGGSDVDGIREGKNGPDDAQKAAAAGLSKRQVDVPAAA